MIFDFKLITRVIIVLVVLISVLIIPKWKESKEKAPIGICYQKLKSQKVLLAQDDLTTWRATIGQLKEQEIWSQRDVADASEILMIPMHFAFLNGFEEGMQDFSFIFSKFSRNELPGGQLNQAEWMYFTSQYLTLKTKHKLPWNSDDVALLTRVRNWNTSAWDLDPDFQWESAPFSGIRQRLNYIYGNVDENYPSYYFAMTDYELFVIAINADLIYIQNCLSKEISGLSQSATNVNLQENFRLGIKLVKDRWDFIDSGALFQRGFWRDHPDYLYAGNGEIRDDLAPLKVNNLSEDSSHSHRWPLWLRSFEASIKSSGNDLEWITNLIHLNSSQFKEKVTRVHDGSVFLTNFMDGTNGIYRYQYQTIGRNELKGFGPYMLSGILGSSWYPFNCNVEGIFLAYSDSYPLNRRTLITYVGPNTSRVRNDFFSWPNFFTSGFAELLAEQSLNISKHNSRCLDPNR